jgi:hypothetical protein
MLCLWPLSVIQLSGWKKSFGDNSNPAIKTQYDQMQSSFHLHFDIILVSLYSLQISIIGFRGLITIWRKLRWINILIPLSIIACFSAVCVAFIFPSKPAEEFAQEILKVRIFHLCYNILDFLFFHRMNMHCRKYPFHWFIPNFSVYQLLFNISF